MTWRANWGPVLRWGLPLGATVYLGYLLAKSDPRQLLAGLDLPTLAVAGAAAVIYGLAFYLLALAWGVALRRFAGKPLDLPTVVQAYALANFAKYLPGNILHYVGRQLAATRLGCSQASAARATATEIALHLVASGTLLLLLLPFAAGELGWLRSIVQLAANLWPLSLLAFAVAAVGLVFLARRNGGWRVEASLGIGGLAQLLCLQLVFFTLATGVGTWLAVTLLPVPPGNMPAVAFAFLFSWLAAFVVPGAPGGLGVREACLAAALQAYGDLSSILLLVALSRIVLVVGEGIFALSAWGLRATARPAAV